jgi:two-component system chemotaxis family response regulator WspR
MEIPGLLKREPFLESAERRWAHALENETPLSLVMISIDNFREYGGTAADVCLRSIVEAIKDNVRQTSCLVGAVRDHEIAVLCNACHEPEAVALAERIRDGVAALNLQPTLAGGPLGVSVCVVTRPPRPDRFFESLLIAADRGLRDAARYGGNEVVCR